MAGPLIPEYRGVRRRLVETLQTNGISDLAVLRAFELTPRHLFVPSGVRHRAYEDSALPIGSGQTISQPSVHARYLQLLQLTGHETVLEVGTGSGYQTVLLSYLAARVFSIERINELGLVAADLVRKLHLHNVSVKVFDGTYGWSDQAPFDRIIVAAAAPEIPEPLVQQLARGGKMMIPIGEGGKQRLARVSKVATRLHIEDCGPAEFVPLVGKFGWKE